MGLQILQRAMPACWALCGLTQSRTFYVRTSKDCVDAQHRASTCPNRVCVSQSACKKGSAGMFSDSGNGVRQFVNHEGSTSPNTLGPIVMFGAPSFARRQGTQCVSRVSENPLYNFARDGQKSWGQVNSAAICQWMW